MAQLNSAGYNARQAYGTTFQNGAFERLTRIGFASKGVVYLLIGVLALMAAFGNGGETTNKEGVLERIAAQPFGDFALAVIGVGLMAYAIWRMLCCFMDSEHEGKQAKGIGKRVYYGVSGFLYASASIAAFRLLTGSGAAGGGSQQSWTARLMDAPAGTLLVILAGIAIIAGGLSQMREGWKEKFREHLRLGSMQADHKHWAVKAGKWGYVARGIVFSIIGGFVIQAALSHDPGRVRGMEGALDKLAAQPFGQWLLAFVAAGLVCYGAYCFVEARYRSVSV